MVSSPPDGYTILAIAHVHAINATLYKQLPYNFIRDVEPVAGMVQMPNVMEVHPSVPAKSVAEFIAYAKANEGKLSYASAGNGTSAHLATELFKAMTGVQLLHVPYRGSGPALIDMISGRVHVMFDTLSSSIPHIRDGKLRALAVTSRSPPGSASACRRARRPRSSTSSTARSTRRSPIRRSGRGLPSSAPCRFRQRRPRW